MTRESATLAADACGSFSGSDPVTITAGDDADALTTGCYRYTLTGTDNVGNTVAISTIVKLGYGLFVDGQPHAVIVLGLDPLGAESFEHRISVDPLGDLDDVDEPRAAVIGVVGERSLDPVHPCEQLAVAGGDLAP